MSNNRCRLRKYKRKKGKAKTIEDFDRLTILYYRYARKVFGPMNEGIWGGKEDEQSVNA